MEERVEDLSGVAGVTVKGLPDEEIVIELDQDRLKDRIEPFLDYECN